MEGLSLFVRRPIFALMINVAISVVGAICYFTLNVDLMPKVSFPVVAVQIQLAGAAPQVMEQQVTRQVEDAVAQLGGLDYIKSTSTTGFSATYVVFQLSKDPNVASQEVRDKVDGILNNLPKDIQTPIIQKIEESATPVISLVISGPQAPGELTEIARNQIKNAISSVDGVGQVNLVGAQVRQVNVELDHKRLQGYGVAVSDVTRAVGQQNQEAGGGVLQSNLFQLPMRTRMLVDSIPELNDVVVKTSGDIPILLSDVGAVEDGTQDVTSISRLDDTRALTLQVVKNTDANTMNVIDGVKKRVKDLETEVPAGVKMVLTQDQSIFIQDSVHDILEHLVLGSLLAGLMVLLFLGNVRATLISAVAIPCSLLGGFVAMRVFDQTLNQITLLALALVVGIVIDDAVVVLEEIVRLMDEEGLAPFPAAEKGIQTIGFSVLATTLSLAVIFLPIAFLPGIVGAYFVGYGITMATTIMVSMVVSFTLTPMLCSVFLKPTKHAKRRGPGFYEHFLDRPYAWLLYASLRMRFLVILACVGVIAWGVWLYQHVGQDFVAPQDDGTLNVKITAPGGNSVFLIDRMVTAIAQKIRKEVPEVDYTLTTVGGDITSGARSNQAQIFVQMKPWDERAKHRPTYTVFHAQRKIRGMLAAYPMLRSSVLLGQADFQCVLRGPDLDVLTRSAQQLVAELRKTPGYADVDTDQDPPLPEADVYVDRDRAFRLGVQPLDVAQTVQTLIGGNKVSSFYAGDERLDIVVRLKPDQRTEAQVIPELMVSDSQGNLVPLADLVQVVWQPSATVVNRFNRQRQVTVLCNLDGVALGQAMKHGEDLVQAMKLPPEYSVTWSGNAQYMAPTLLVFAASFLVSVVFMYMVLASQFESFMDPAIILATLPLSIPFAFFSLLVTGKTLNIFSALGLFLLIGVVKKNAIFQIDTTRVLLAEGKPLYHAMLAANRLRLRPILMTTVTLVVAMAPVAMSGANGWTRSPMAIVIVGGQALCLLLTLVVVPVLYSYAHDFRGRLYREEMAGRSGASLIAETERHDVHVEVEPPPEAFLDELPDSRKTRIMKP